MLVVNNARGPRGLNLANGGTVYIEAGQKLDVPDGTALFDGVTEVQKVAEKADEKRPRGRPTKSE